MHEGHDGARRTVGTDPVLVMLFALGVLIVPWFVAGPGGGVSSWVLQAVVDGIICVLAARIARLCAGNRPAVRLWHAILAGAALCGIGDVHQTVLVLIGPADQPASVMQTACVVLGMVLIVGVMLCHPLGGSGRQRLRLWLDTATVLTGVAVFLWYFSLAEVVVAESRAQLYSRAATAAIELLVVFAVLKLVLSGTAPFTRTAGILASLGVTGSAVGPWVVSLITGGDGAGATAVAQLLPSIAVAVSLRIQELQERRRVADRAVPRRRRASRLPYLAVIASQVLLVTTLPRLGPDLRVWGVTAGVLLSTVLVLGRQAAAFTDNERLLTELDRTMAEMRALHGKLHHQATHDPLTGLANRSLLEQRLAEAPAGDRVALLLVDLDGFKPVNDRHGHQAGDRVLVAVAARMAAETGDEGLVVRLGGDEFAVLLPLGGSDPAALADRIARVVAEPIPVTGGPVRVGASVGVATGSPRDADAILRAADAAMYRSKADRKAVGSGAGR